jgi:tRNA_anti-like
MSSIALTRQAPYPVRVQQRRCGKCGKLVSRAAYACRRCGKSQRMRPRTLLLFLAGGLMVGMFAVASAGALVPQARPVESSAAQSPSAVRAPATSSRAPELSATDLWIAYSRSAAEADRSYRDRSLAVTGIVRSIDRNYEGDMVVRLGTGDAFDTVNATLATRNDPALAGLTKGRVASLLCVGRGALMGAPLLGGCFLR